MFESLNLYSPDVEVVRQMMTRMGFSELRTPQAVDEALKEQGLSMVFVNSMCGCAGGIARPAAMLALQQGKARPDHLYTVFAGQDKEATARAREYFTPFPPSSPSIALLKGGKLVYMLERHQIEGRDPQSVAQVLARALEQAAAG